MILIYISKLWLWVKFCTGVGLSSRGPRGFGAPTHPLKIYMYKWYMIDIIIYIFYNICIFNVIFLNNYNERGFKFAYFKLVYITCDNKQTYNMQLIVYMS